jgi:uncharacterized protein
MKQRIKTLCAGGFLALALFGSATAGPLDDGYTAYQRGDYAAPMKYSRPLADQGIAEAQFAVGAMYEGGQGVSKDDAQALAWYRKAADQGNANAQAALASMYHGGRGVRQDYAEALIWFRKAADQEGSIPQAIAQANLGVMHENGEGVPQDYVLAHMWFNLASSRAPDAKVRDVSAKARDLVAAQR